jgi:hypothetical protein
MPAKLKSATRFAPLALPTLRRLVAQADPLCVAKRRCAAHRSRRQRPAAAGAHRQCHRYHSNPKSWPRSEALRETDRLDHMPDNSKIMTEEFLT